MDKSLRHGLPEQCLFVNSYGDIMSIEYGKDGVRRFERDTNNRIANHEIVSLYNELHGVTDEIFKIMHKAALLGWDKLDALLSLKQQESSVKEGCIFEIEISRPGSFGASTAVDISLPATPYELEDALDKARITDERVIYSVEVLACKMDYLPQFISSSTNLYELNHLAQRLASLSQWELDCFTGMTMMDAIKTNYSPIAIERLINMTHSTEDCQVVHEAHDDLTLGKFYADNGFVPKLESLPDEIYECLDFSKIGKEMREGEGGVLTPHGYVVQNGEMAQAYQSGDAIPLEKPDYTILLSIGKGYFNDPEYDNDLTVRLRLPVDDAAVSKAVETVRAASLRECTFHVEDCIVPSLSERITDELNDCDGDITMVDALAEQLQKLKHTGSILTYKAMLEEPLTTISIEDALDLACKTEGYSLLKEAVTPEDYAQLELVKFPVPLKEDMFTSTDLYQYGSKLMEEQSASATGYGILVSHNGQTVKQYLSHSEYVLKME